MNRYTRMLRDPDDTLNMMRRYAVDPASAPEGFEKHYTRKLDSTHGDFSGFQQTVLRIRQRIAWVKLHRKREHTLDAGTGGGGAAGSLQTDASLEDDGSGDAVPCYFLPWDNEGATVQMSIPQNSSTDLKTHPCVFFTAALSGCSVIFKGTPQNPTIIHGGSGQKVLPYDANQFWKDFVEHLDSHPDPLIRHDRHARSVKDQVTKSQYVTEKTITSPTGGQIKTTQRAVDFQRMLSKHYGDTVEIMDVIPFGAVFGVRRGNDWTFYLQENATIQYYPREQIRKVKKNFFGFKSGSYLEWQRVMGPVRLVSRPMAVTAVFPGGSGRVQLTKRWRSLLRSDQLITAPSAFPYD